MKLSRLATRTCGIILLSGGLLGATYATTIAHQTSVCAVISQDYSHAISSLTITPYDNGSPLSTQYRGAKDNCVTFDTDWLMGVASAGTSFHIEGHDANGNTFVLENRDKAMFSDIKDNTKVTLYYDIFLLSGAKGSFPLGSTQKETRLHDNGTTTSTRQYGWYKSDAALNDAFLAIEAIGATKYTNVTDFKGGDDINREQAAKFFVKTWEATHAGTKLPPLSATCTFTDDSTADQTLKADIYTACQLGLMKGGSGKFRPKAMISLAEVTAILVRMKYGMLNESGTPWYRNYFDKAFDINLFDSFAYNPHILLDGNLTISRGLIGFMIRSFLSIEHTTNTP